MFAAANTTFHEPVTMPGHKNGPGQWSDVITNTVFGLLALFTAMVAVWVAWKQYRKSVGKPSSTIAGC